MHDMRPHSQLETLQSTGSVIIVLLFHSAVNSGGAHLGRVMCSPSPDAEAVHSVFLALSC